MRRLAALASALSLLAIASPASAADACKRTRFDTKLVREACAKGGQNAAKDAMQAFQKDKKLKSCNECHTSLPPNYPLKSDGLARYKKLGGK